MADIRGRISRRTVSSILRIDAGAALFVNGVQTAVFEPEHLEEQIGGCLLEV